MSALRSNTQATINFTLIFCYLLHAVMFNYDNLYFANLRNLFRYAYRVYYISKLLRW